MATTGRLNHAKLERELRGELGLTDYVVRGDNGCRKPEEKPPARLEVNQSRTRRKAGR